MDVRIVDCARISVPVGRLRGIDPEAVDRLQASIMERGLMTPITVRPVGTGFELVVGAHRFAAVLKLGAVDIAARIVAMDDLEARLAEIDENLVRNDLTVLERAEHLAERKCVYLLQHPETKHGTAGGLASGTSRANGRTDATVASVQAFHASTAAQTGIAERTIQLHVQIAESIAEDVRMALRGTPVARSTRQLTALAGLPPDGQRAVVATTDLADAAAVKVAITARAAPYGRTRRRTAGPKPGRRVREVVAPRTAEVVRFVHTLGGLDLFLQIDPAALLGHLEQREVEALRSTVRRFDAWVAAFERTFGGDP